MEGEGHAHQSLALLAGVAVDKGSESDGTTTVIHHVTSARNGIFPPGNTAIDYIPRDQILQFPSHHATTVPIRIEVAQESGLEGAHTTEVVEVEYILGPSGEFHVADAEVASEIGAVMDHSTPRLRVISTCDQELLETVGDHLIEEEAVGGLVVDDEIIRRMRIDELIPVNGAIPAKIEDFKEPESEQDNENSMSSESKSEGVEGDRVQKCFVCQRTGLYLNFKDLFGEENKNIMLPQLLNRYMGVSIVPKYNSKNDFPICEACTTLLQRWHEVSIKFKDRTKNESAASSAMDLSEGEDDNSQDDQAIISNNNSIKKPRGKYQKTIGSRKYRYALLQSRIKTCLFNSPAHYLIKRELSEDDWEYVAERLHTTKSNSSTKIKEIEMLTFDNDKLVSIFCDDCRKSIPGGKDGYYAHRKTFHDDKEGLTLPCDICGQFYPVKDSTGLSRNFFPHWINHFYFEECQHCKETFPNPSLLKKHLKIHQRRSGFPCPKCDKVLAKKITLEQHIKTHLPEEEKKKHALTCHICGKTITAPTLKAHMFSVHSDERPWKCEVCGALFKHKSDLSGHRNAVHLKIKNFNCTVCGKSFGHQCGLRIHMMKHENRREHVCQTCGKKFITQWHLKKHTVTHKSEKDIICKDCGKGFKKIEALQEHMTIHTGEMPHECHICGRRVRVLSNLYKHYMVHKKNKTYYSKKDGLPDPLDAYIGEQQKKKQVNEIVQRNAVLKETNSTLVPENSIIEVYEDFSPTKVPRLESVYTVVSEEPELKVNRSSTRITYRGPASTSTGESSTLAPTNTTLLKEEPSAKRLILAEDMMADGIDLSHSLGSSSQSKVYVTTTDGNYSVRLPNGEIAIVQPSPVVYKVVDESSSVNKQIGKRS